MSKIIPLALIFTLCFSFQCQASLHKKSEWIKEAFETLKQEKFPRIKALSYWHENWVNEKGKEILLRIDSTLASLDAYRAGIKSKQFLSTLQFERLEERTVLSEPESGMYLAAYPDFGGLEENVSSHQIFEFETLTRKKIAWAYFSNNWSDKIEFPSAAIDNILAQDKVPFIRIMVRDIKNPHSFGQINFQKIIDGDLDTEILAWAKKIKSLGRPVLIEFCPEANGDWFPWSGAEVTADTYIEAHRRMVELTRQVHANNLTWFFHLNARSVPTGKWNSFDKYYPGDEYIDWIGISLYGPYRKEDCYESFEEILEQTYPLLSTLSDKKPLAILEWGIGEEN